jgi:hypothetical protein
MGGRKKMQIRKLLAPSNLHGSKRTPKEIALHHKAAFSTNDQTLSNWKNQNSPVSANYGVYEADVAMFVPEGTIAYCQGTNQGNQDAISIEVSNSSDVQAANYASVLKKGDALGWPVSEATLQSTIELVADVADRNNFYPLVPGKNLKWHALYKATACPGPYMVGKVQYIADEANKLIATERGEVEQPDGDLYGVMRQVIVLTGKDKAQAYADKLNKDDPGAYYKVALVQKAPTSKKTAR